MSIANKMIQEKKVIEYKERVFNDRDCMFGSKKWNVF